MLHMKHCSLSREQQWLVHAQYPFIQAVDIEVLDLGEQPPAIGGAKSYAASNDEATLEAPVLWGGDARVRVAVRVKLGGYVLYLPVEVRDLQVTHASCLCSIHIPALALDGRRGGISTPQQVMEGIRGFC